jgi:hypothetical protein
MNSGKITDLLRGLFDTGQTRATKRDTAINELLEKLHHKEARYLARLPLAETEKETAKLQRQLAVCRAQIAKATGALAGGE